MAKQYEDVLEGLRRRPKLIYLKDREELFKVTREQRRKLHDQLVVAFKAMPEFAKELGLDPTQKFEVDQLRRALESTPMAGMSRKSSWR